MFFFVFVHLSVVPLRTLLLLSLPPPPSLPPSPPSSPLSFSQVLKEQREEAACSKIQEALNHSVGLQPGKRNHLHLALWSPYITSHMTRLEQPYGRDLAADIRCSLGMI